MAQGPSIDPLDTLLRRIVELERQVEILKIQNSRYVSFGTSYRIQVSGNGAAAVLQAVRTADGNTVQIAP